MGAEQEFTEYVGTRWPRLVRTAVLLGCTRAEAEAVVGAALSCCLARWSEVRRAEDREAHVHHALVDAFRTERREHWPGEHPAEHPLVGEARFLTGRTVYSMIGDAFAYVSIAVTVLAAFLARRHRGSR